MPYRALVPVLLAVALALPPRGAAQASAHLQPLDPVHRDLDRLAAWGLIDTILVGQRPYSRAQAARLTARALRGRARLPAESPLAPAANRALARLTGRLAPELEAIGVLLPLDEIPLRTEVRVDAGWTDSPGRTIPDNQLGTTAAILNPLRAYDLGRSARAGTSAGVELAVAGTAGSRVAGSVRTRAELVAPEGGDTDVLLDLATASGRVLLGNVALTVGREHVVWGQSPRGGLVLSTNPGALLAASIANEFPAALPGPLGVLGPARVQLLFADLGTEAQRFAHTTLFGARASILPSPRLELGAQLLVQSGGEGAPSQSLRDRLLDYLFLPDVFSKRELEASNKLAALDARLRVPEARGLELWVEMAIDDIDIDRFRSMMWEDGSWSVGARIERLDAEGRLALRLEGEHTGLRMYEHFQFTSGLTLAGRLLGSELGPNANAGTLGLDWELGDEDALLLEGTVERRSVDPYRLIAGTPYYFARTDILPAETRWRARAAWERRTVEGRFDLRVETGYERVEGFAFTEGRTLHSLLARTVLVARVP